MTILRTHGAKELTAGASVGVKHSITTGAGVIDADYRGKVGVLLFNLGDKDFESELRFTRIRPVATAC